MMKGIFLILLVCIQPILGDQRCLVSGTLRYEDNDMNGEYIQTYRRCINGTFMDVWYKSDNNIERVFVLIRQDTTEINDSNRTVSSWVIKSGGCVGRKVLAMNQSPFSNTPSDVWKSWYQYDSYLDVYFTNTQISVSCYYIYDEWTYDNGLSTGEIVGIVIGSLCGLLLLGVLLFCVCKRCKRSKLTKQTASTTSLPTSTISTNELSSQKPNTGLPPAYLNDFKPELQNKLPQ